MIDVYFWPTPNCYKVTLFLEEAGISYRIIAVDIGQGAQFRSEFSAISPNSRIPAIVDHLEEDVTAIPIFESGAILVYLAEKIGRFLPEETSERTVVMQWLFWQVGGLGPMAGQAHHFRHYAPELIPYAVDRYTTEVTRLYGVLDRRLDGRGFLADGYSIADMAVFPWVNRYAKQGQDLARFPNVARWFRSISERPATNSAYRTGPVDPRSSVIAVV
ncbi:glutathione S-transferase C-terminal domain-containing protein [Rhizobium azibense]|uniref:GST-like protein n=1 Tax=Rhizobium azibense TaxID=1136135 RepID=A0A4R3S9X7_9HYPH|nr:glutathione S-transferase C-terminal domain-containing protein [Rhizobium azibense]TCU41366.1 GST-like protein [Rhizobium azibense]